MATRTSLTSRGFTSVNAGVSSTNRFLKAPRAVGEYTTVAQELADLRTAKNAVGPAAQPLRPRARVDAGGGGEGYSPTAAESFNLNFSEMTLGQMRSTLADTNAKQKGSSDITKGGSLLGPTPIGLMTGIMSIGVGITKSALENSINNRTTSLTQDKEGTPKTEPSSLIGKIGTDISSNIKGTLNEIGNVIDNPVDYTKGVVDEEFVTPVVETYNSALTGLNTLFSKVTPSLISPPITTTITTRIEKANNSKAEKREKRSLNSKANQVEVDLREAKEKQQKAVLASVAAANARGRNSNVGNRSSSTSSTGNSGFSSGSAVDFGGGNNFSSDF